MDEDIASINDKDSLERYLRQQPRNISLLVAHRAAASVLPVHENWAVQHPDLATLDIWRCNLIACVACHFPHAQFHDVADCAVDSIDEIALTADAEDTKAADAGFAAMFAAECVYNENIFASAAIAADYADHALYAEGREIWPTVRHDLQTAHSVDTLLNTPLWPRGMLPGLRKMWNQIKANRTGPDWTFWINWYEALLAGHPQDWDTLRKVALISDMDWGKGVDHVNQMISECVQ